MKYKHLFLFVVLAIMSSSCSNIEDIYNDSTIQIDTTRSSELIIYPISSFIDTISVSTDVETKLNEIALLMQNDLGNGYNPLIHLLIRNPINKIYSGVMTLNSVAGYNPITNRIIIGSTASHITANMFEEELIHAGQNRVYPGGISQYLKTSGNSNIEFEAKLTQDLISYVNGGYINLGATSENIVEYTYWIIDLCESEDSDVPSFPSMEKVLHTRTDDCGYYQMVESFSNQYGQYNYPVLNNLDPLYINFTYINYGKY